MWREFRWEDRVEWALGCGPPASFVLLCDCRDRALDFAYMGISGLPKAHIVSGNIGSGGSRRRSRVVCDSKGVKCCIQMFGRSEWKFRINKSSGTHRPFSSSPRPPASLPRTPPRLSAPTPLHPHFTLSATTKSSFPIDSPYPAGQSVNIQPIEDSPSSKVFWPYETRPVTGVLLCNPLPSTP